MGQEDRPPPPRLRSAGHETKRRALRPPLLDGAQLPNRRAPAPRLWPMLVTVLPCACPPRLLSTSSHFFSPAAQVIQCQDDTVRTHLPARSPRCPGRSLRCWESGASGGSGRVRLPEFRAGWRRLHPALEGRVLFKTFYYFSSRKRKPT